MYNIVIKPKAIEMAKDAYDWYEEQQAGLGNLFLKELDRCSQNAGGWPESYAKIKNNYRQVVFRTFPYVLVFEVIDTDVIIYAVFHTSRHPRKKFSK